LKASLEANPIAKGAFLEPGEITTVVMPSFKQVRITVCAEGITGYIITIQMY
jgi:hypothetical protein